MVEIRLVPQWVRIGKRLLTTNYSKVNPLKELIPNNVLLYSGRPKATCPLCAHSHHHSARRIAGKV